jgi:multisubunit Na+/H+ antiporter MnhG subunit
VSDPRRTRPLGRADIPADAPASTFDDEEPIEASDIVMTPVAPAAVSGNGTAAGILRLADGVRALRTGGGKLKWSERQLLYLAGIIAPLGLILVLLGWYGASHTPNLFEQVPYMISGGLFGLGLCFIGSIFYFAHWLTELVREQRAQSAALLEAITHLETVIARTAVVERAGEPAGGVAEHGPLVATAKGTMAHRPECVVVAGKGEVRPVTPDDGLLPCKLCDPYAEVLN